MSAGESTGQATDVQMPFTSHLEELRSRLIKSCSALAVAFIACFQFADQIFSVLVEPLSRVEVAGLVLIGTAVTEAFFTKMKVSFAAAIVVTLPILLWQGWQFVAPGLYEHEKRYTRSFVLFGSFFFLAGAGLCYQIVLQHGLYFLLQRYEAINVQPTIRIAEYLSVASRLVLAFGIMFELPVVIYFLARVGLVDHRFLIHHSRYAVILIAVLAAVLTPPDLISQLLLMVPFAVLYGISIGIAYFARPKASE
ncbi:MAG: twin-arginine translocase subunit TatC [Candidatus Binatia bacterium]